MTFANAESKHCHLQQQHHYDDDDDDDRYMDVIPNDKEATPLIADEATKNAPPDTYNAVYWIFFLQGLGMLFPWNAFITAHDYYHYAFSGSPFRSSFLSFFTSTFQISNMASLILVMHTQHKFPLSYRIQIPLILQFIIFLAITCLVEVDIPAVTLFWITLAFVFFSGSATAFLQGGVFGLSGLMPMKYMQAVMGGQALGGVLVSLIYIFASVGAHSQHNVNSDVNSDATKNSAIVYFSISTFIIFLCFISYLVLLRLPLVKYYLKLRLAHRADGRKKNFKFRIIWKQIWPLCLSVGYTFFITLLIFPAITSSIQPISSSSNAFYTYLFIPVYCFLIFNMGDWLGRTIAGYIQFPKAGKAFYLAVLSRIIFVPLFILCKSVDTVNYFVFNNDAWPIIFMIFFSVTNGYFGSLCMMFGPVAVDIPSKEAAGAMMVLGLTSGLTLGCFCSFALKAFLCNCNSFVE